MRRRSMSKRFALKRQQSEEGEDVEASNHMTTRSMLGRMFVKISNAVGFNKLSKPIDPLVILLLIRSLHMPIQLG